jgi:transcriptional regulator with XRE-family HTH domain
MRPWNEKMGAALRFYRTQAKLTQMQVQEMTGISQGWLSVLENGTQDNRYCLDTVIMLARTYDTTVSQIMATADL